MKKFIPIVALLLACPTEGTEAPKDDDVKDVKATDEKTDGKAEEKADEKAAEQKEEKKADG